MCETACAEISLGGRYEIGKKSHYYNDFLATHPTQTHPQAFFFFFAQVKIETDPKIFSNFKFSHLFKRSNKGTIILYIQYYVCLYVQYYVFVCTIYMCVCVCDLKYIKYLIFQSILFYFVLRQ